MKMFRVSAWVDDAFYVIIDEDTLTKHPEIQRQIEKAGYKLIRGFPQSEYAAVKLLVRDINYWASPPKFMGYIMVQGGHISADKAPQIAALIALRKFAKDLGWTLHELYITHDGAGIERATDPDGKHWYYGWTWPAPYTTSWTGLHETDADGNFID